VLIVFFKTKLLIVNWLKKVIRFISQQFNFSYIFPINLYTLM